jgi:hypothetical protein
LQSAAKAEVDSKDSIDVLSLDFERFQAFSSHSLLLVLARSNMDEFGRRAPSSAAVKASEAELATVEEFLGHTTLETIFQSIMSATTQEQVSMALKALGRIFGCSAAFKLMTGENNVPYLQGGVGGLNDAVRLFTLKQLKLVCLTEPISAEQHAFVSQEALLEGIWGRMSDENIEIMQVAEDMLVAIADDEEGCKKVLALITQASLEDSTIHMRILSLVSRLAIHSAGNFDACDSA